MAHRRPPAPPSRNPFDPLDGPVTETLDLHGYSGVDVRAYVSAFLRDVQRRCPGGLLHIITGRGRNSPGGPVLKPLVRRLLAEAPASTVEAWGRDDHDGGFLVRLAGRTRR